MTVIFACYLGINQEGEGSFNKYFCITFSKKRCLVINFILKITIGNLRHECVWFILTVFFDCLVSFIVM